MTPREIVLSKIPKKRKAKRRRDFNPELKKEIMDYYDTITGKGNKAAFAKEADMDQNTITRWDRDRTKEKRQSTIKRRNKNNAAKALMTNSSTGSKTPGTTLQGILVGMKDMDIVSKIEMIDTLSDAGYKEELVVPYINTLPSIEDWNKIKQAVALLAKEYNITRKE